MANFAELSEESRVLRVLVFNGTEAEGIAHLKATYGGTWVLAGDGDKGKHAGIGDEYHADINIFIKKPFNSWVLDKNLKIYLPPIPKPIALVVGFIWAWSEAVKSWVRERVRN